MEGVNTYDVGTLAGLKGVAGYGYGFLGGGQGRGQEFLAFQNNRNLSAIKDGTVETIDSIQKQTMLQTIQENATRANVERQFDFQTAGNNARFAALESKLDNVTGAIAANEINRLRDENVIAQNKLALKEGCVNATCNTCKGNGGGVDAQAIQIAVGNGIAQGLSQLAGILKNQ